MSELGDRTVMPQVIPWMDDCMSKASFSRNDAEEGFILLVNLTVLGVVSAHEKSYSLQLLTDFLATHRKNAVALVLHANRAKTPAGSPTKGSRAQTDSRAFVPLRSDFSSSFYTSLHLYSR